MNCVGFKVHFSVAIEAVIEDIKRKECNFISVSGCRFIVKATTQLVQVVKGIILLIFQERKLSWKIDKISISSFSCALSRFVALKKYEALTRP